MIANRHMDHYHHRHVIPARESGPWGKRKVGGMMDITTTLRLNPAEKKQLAGILHCQPSELSEKLGSYSNAAALEYIQMFLGQKVFTRGSDIREFRLFLLIRHAFNNTIPDEQTVCGLFQCTSSQSRSLIRSVMSKYQYELYDAITSTLTTTLQNATVDGDGEGVVITIINENVVEALNRELASLDGTLPQVVKKKGTVSTWELRESSYLTLCTHFRISNPVIQTDE